MTSSSSLSSEEEDRRHRFRHKRFNRHWYLHYYFYPAINLLLLLLLFLTNKSGTGCIAFMPQCHNREHILNHQHKLFPSTKKRGAFLFPSSMTNQASPETTEKELELRQRNVNNKDDDDDDDNIRIDDTIPRHQEKDDLDKSKKWGQSVNSTVYEDLEKLEKAITLENAELKLRQAKLKEQVDFIDQSKRPIVPDALRYMMVPLIYALILNILISSKVVKIRMIARSITKVMDLHFWSFVVWIPIFFSACKRICKPRPDPIPRGLDPELIEMFISPLPLVLDGWEDPETSCTDYVLFLSEYWTSAVNGIACVQILKTITTKFLTANSKGIVAVQSPYWIVLWLSCTQLLTRMGAVASLYQYPEILYELERSSLTRPVGLFPTIMWKLVRAMVILAPLGFISDFAKVLSHLPTGTVYPLYGSLAVYILGTWTRMKETSSEDPFKNYILKPPKFVANIFYRLCYVVLWRKQIQWLKLGKRINNIWASLWSSYEQIFWKCIGIGYLMSLSLLGPIAHLKAISKILQIEYTNDLPALSTEKSYNQIRDDHPERYNDRKWMYSLRWREPERAAVSKGWLYSYLLYWYFLKRSIAERNSNYFWKNNRRRLESGRTLSERMKGENFIYLSGDRGEWKSSASKFQAENHQKQYATKKYTDPLGVAVYRAFGIGIGYNFDHHSELEEGKEPSVRRLQARAAKSAVRRYNELTDREKQIEKLNETLNPKEEDDHDRKIQQMKKKVDDEIKFIGSRLLDLIPVGSGDLEEFGEVNTSIFQKKKVKFRKVSSHMYSRLKDDPLDYEKTIISAPNNATTVNEIESKENDDVGNININNYNDENGTDGLLDIVSC
mmetsp:Transcript_42402/g.47383  ORF Transcript_42402/g.47383 Transcript_42402/m.47383 type:complete len:841 (+) Transcript_42402:151-2673(+)